MSITLYGIPNCDTVRKARGWLEGKGLDYTFHDYKKSGVDRSKLLRWIDERGLDTVLNRRGPTFRKLDDGLKADLDADGAAALRQEHTSAIRRPIVEYTNDDGEGLLVGFDEQEWSTALAGEFT